MTQQQPEYELKENEMHLHLSSVPSHFGAYFHLEKAMQMFIQALAQRQSLCKSTAFLSAINVSLFLKFSHGFGVGAVLI